MSSEGNNATDKGVALKGSCRCSAVHYQSSSLPDEISICHCTICQKASGAPFMVFGRFYKADLSWKGNSFKTSSSEAAIRTHCSSCGSPLSMEYKSRPDITSIAMGTVDDKSVVGSLPKPSEHIFLESKASWWDISDDDKLPKHQKFSEDSQRFLDGWLGEQSKKA